MVLRRLWAGAPAFFQNGNPIAVSATGNTRTVTQVELTTASSIYCGEARSLLDTLADAIHKLIQVHEEQFNAIIQGDLDCTRFDLSIREANKAKYAAKYDYLHHLEEHGCSTELREWPGTRG